MPKRRPRKPVAPITLSCPVLDCRVPFQSAGRLNRHFEQKHTLDDLPFECHDDLFAFWIKTVKDSIFEALGPHHKNTGPARKSLDCTLEIAIRFVEHIQAAAEYANLSKFGKQLQLALSFWCHFGPEVFIGGLFSSLVVDIKIDVANWSFCVILKHAHLLQFLDLNEPRWWERGHTSKLITYIQTTRAGLSYEEQQARWIIFRFWVKRASHVVYAEPGVNSLTKDEQRTKLSYKSTVKFFIARHSMHNPPAVPVPPPPSPPHVSVAESSPPDNSSAARSSSPIHLSSAPTSASSVSSGAHITFDGTTDDGFIVVD